jgi:hypothetical protein
VFSQFITATVLTPLLSFSFDDPGKIYQHDTQPVEMDGRVILSLALIKIIVSPAAKSQIQGALRQDITTGYSSVIAPGKAIAYGSAHCADCHSLGTLTRCLNSEKN